MVLGLFKLEIINKLKNNYGFDVNTALRYWQQAQIGIKPGMSDGKEKEYVESCISYVKTVMDQLLAECPFKGFPIIMGRNPRTKYSTKRRDYEMHVSFDATRSPAHSHIPRWNDVRRAA